MEDLELVVVFCIDNQSFAVSASSVDFVARAVSLTPLPNAPEIISGLINARGKVIPVVNLRKRSGFPQRPLRASDYLLIAHTPRRALALAVDAALGLQAVSHDSFAPAKGILPGVPHIEGVLKHPDGMILIHDLERFLSLEEERDLDFALGNCAL